MKVLLTGEAGMTSRLLEDSLSKAGHKIVWGMRHRNELLCDFPGVWDPAIVELDINSEAFRRVVREKRPDVIVHSAGFVSTAICKERPQEAIINNVCGTQSVIEAALEVDADLVYFSTTAIFDPRDYGPQKLINNSTRKFPGTLYGVTKLAGEFLVERQIPENRYLIIRPCFMWGDKFDMHSNLMKALLSIKYGYHYDILMDPVIAKDYTYVRDAVGIITGLIDRNCHGEFNVTRGQPMSFGMYVETIERVLGKSPNFKYLPETDYLHHHVVGHEEAIKASGYTPQWDFDAKLINKVYSEI